MNEEQTMQVVRSEWSGLKAALDYAEGVLSQVAPDDSSWFGVERWTHETIDSGAYAGAKGLLETAREQVQMLAPDGKWGMEVERGERTLSSWQQLYDGARIALQELVQNIGEAANSLDRFWTQVVQPTFQEVKEDAKSAATWGVSGLVLVILVLLLLVILVKF